VGIGVNVTRWQIFNLCICTRNFSRGVHAFFHHWISKCSWTIYSLLLYYLFQEWRTCSLSRSAWIVHYRWPAAKPYRWPAAKPINFILKLSLYLTMRTS